VGRFRGLLLAALISSLALAACGPSAADHPTTVASTSTCLTQDLQVEIGLANVAMGHVAQEIRLKNRSSQSCTLRGYPVLEMLDASGARLTTRLHFGADYIVPALRVSTVTLAPKGVAGFLVGYEDATGYSGVTCPTSHTIRIFPPHNTRAIVVTWHLSPYGGTTTALQCGLLTVSPIAPVSALKM
jgi:Domain of unknown function (DUF4232)